MTSTHARTGIRYGYYVLPVMPVAPVKPVTDCDTCNHGCDCEMGKPGCQHFGCWGTHVDDVTDTCPDAPAHIDHMLASFAYRRDLHAYNQASHRR